MQSQTPALCASACARRRGSCGVWAAWPRCGRGALSSVLGWTACVEQDTPRHCGRLHLLAVLRQLTNKLTTMPSWPTACPPSMHCAGCHARHMRDCLRHQHGRCLHRCLPACGVRHRAPGAGLERQLPLTLQQRVPAWPDILKGVCMKCHLPRLFGQLQCGLPRLFPSSVPAWFKLLLSVSSPCSTTCPPSMTLPLFLSSTIPIVVPLVLHCTAWPPFLETLSYRSWTQVCALRPDARGMASSAGDVLQPHASLLLPARAYVAPRLLRAERRSDRRMLCSVGLSDACGMRPRPAALALFSLWRGVPPRLCRLFFSVLGRKL